MADVLSDVVGTLRIQATLFAMAELSAPWGVQFPPGDGAYFHAVTGDGCWLRVDGRPDALRLEAGNIVLLAQAAAHRVTSSRRGAAPVTFNPATWTPNVLVAAAEPAASGSSTTLVCGAVEVTQPVVLPLLSLLPPVLVFEPDAPSATGLALTLKLLEHEVSQTRPGTAMVLSRLGDVLLVQLLRLWLAGSDGDARGWLPALIDPQLSIALQAMHADPAAPWTVDTLARRASLSRSRFAERFSEVTGLPPLGYLTRWRLTSAAAMLRDGCLVNQVSRAVGYTSEPAFSRAFRRFYGCSPSELRTSPATRR